jgi:hypothetical protein
MVLASASALVGLALVRPFGVGATPPTGAPTAPAQATPAMAADAGVAQADPTTATIVFATSPPVSAMVFWGRKNLGKITGPKPLVIVRPRDSGPLDVMVRATGYLPVQVRAHTFSDQRVVVKLTPPEKKNELLGYKAPLDAGIDVSQAAALDAIADAGTPPPVAPPPFQMVPTSPAQTPAQTPLLMP